MTTDARCEGLNAMSGFGRVQFFLQLWKSKHIQAASTNTRQDNVGWRGTIALLLCHWKQENPEDSSIEFDHLGTVPIHEAHDCLDYCGRPCACPPTRMQASTPKHFMQPEEPDETGMADESTGQTRQSSYAKLEGQHFDCCGFILHELSLMCGRRTHSSRFGPRLPRCGTSGRDLVATDLERLETFLWFFQTFCADRLSRSQIFLDFCWDHLTIWDPRTMKSCSQRQLKYPVRISVGSTSVGDKKKRFKRSMSLWIIWIPDLLGCSMLFISFIIFHVPMWWGFTPLPGSITQSCNLNRPKVAVTDLDSWSWRCGQGEHEVQMASLEARETANWSGHRWALGIALVLEMGCFRVEGCWRLKMHWCVLNVPGRSD